MHHNKSNKTPFTVSLMVQQQKGTVTFRKDHDSYYLFCITEKHQSEESSLFVMQVSLAFPQQV